MSERWVVVSYFEHSPSEIYGTFVSEESARAYAEREKLADGDIAAYEVKCIFEVEN
mgnify:CR=1 FL=1